jgi:7-cyano-7-deazaguanine synthase in queuosine biosynthesis
MTKAVVLLSGGLDSHTAAAINTALHFLFALTVQCSSGRD